MIRKTLVRASVGIMAVLLLGVFLPLTAAPAANAAPAGWYSQTSGTGETLNDVAAVSADTAWVVGNYGTILKTVNGGVDWVPQTSGTYLDLREVGAVDANTAWAVGGDDAIGQGIVLRTIDGGTNWEVKASPAQHGSFLGLSVIDTETVWVCGAEGVLKTSNGGAAWAKVDAGQHFFYSVQDVSNASGLVAWVVYHNGNGPAITVEMTTDGGATWQVQKSFNKITTCAPSSVHAVNSSTAWLTGRGGLLLKTEDGASWTEQTVSALSQVLDLAFSGGDTAWAVGESGKYYTPRILKTTDGGDHWAGQEEFTAELRGVAAVDVSTAWAVGEGGTILHTTDGGGATSAAGTTFYFAEGFTGTNFQEFLTVANADEFTNAIITLWFEDGTSIQYTITMPPHCRQTVDVNAWVGSGKAVSARLIGDPSIVAAERPMYFNYNGLTGGSCVTGVTSLAADWYFAEGTCRPNFDPYITLLNPGNPTANVDINYVLGDTTTKTQSLQVPGHSRVTVKVNLFLGAENDTAHDFSAHVSSTNGVPIVAERPMYFSYVNPSGQVATGGSCVAGATAPATKWYFAEGTARKRVSAIAGAAIAVLEVTEYSPYLCLQNPGATDANVLLTYMLGDQTVKTQTWTVPAHARLTVPVADFLGTGDDVSRDFAVLVDSTGGVPIVAERAMYYSHHTQSLDVISGQMSQSDDSGGSSVVGALVPHAAWFFAEGTTRPGFDPYICVQNPGSSVAHVQIQYLLGDTNTNSQVFDVPAQGRITVRVASVIGSANNVAHDFSAIVTSTGSDIVVERPTYFTWNGWDGGNCTMGYAP